MQIDVREDTDQAAKLDETVDLLLAAGYFRARIKGLSPFDKVCAVVPAHADTSNPPNFIFFRFISSMQYTFTVCFVVFRLLAA